MEEKDLSELLDAIVWAHRIVEVDPKRTFVFRPLTLEERNMANYVYDRTLKHSQQSTQEELKKRAIKKGLWQRSFEKDLQTLREELAKLLDELKEEEERNKSRRTPTAKLVGLRKKVSSVTEVVRSIEDDHTRYIELPSAEYEAECERGIFMLRCATLTFPDMEQRWRNLGALKEETDTQLVARLLHLFYNITIAEEADIRRLARSGFWRSKWNGSKKNRGVRTLFNREMYDLTIDQYHLVFWSQVYDSAFESMEPPSDDVIEDDRLFDRWLDEQHQKRKQERKQTEFEKKLGKAKRGKDANEVAFSTQGFYSEECTCGVKEQAKQFGKDKRGHLHDPSCPHGVFIYYDAETRLKKAEEIQKANPDHIRKILAREQAFLAESGGEVEEQKLRGDKVRAAFGMGTKYGGAGEVKERFKQGKARPS